VPTYQYVCTACGHDLEAVQSFSDPALTDCPACAGRLRKKFGSVGVVFKGSGFYRNDSRGNANASSSNGKAVEKPKADAASTPDGASTAAKSGDSAGSSSSSGDSGSGSASPSSSTSSSKSTPASTAA
jgi:putative FmdB family regulatory protein